MSRKRESKVGTTRAEAVSRRRMLEGLGALAAVTACGSNTDSTTGAAGGPGVAGSPGAAGAANNLAGAAFSKSIHEAVEPYKRRTALSAYADAMKADEAGNSGRHATATKVGNKVVAQIQMVVDPT
jgi:hypothetical protein